MQGLVYLLIGFTDVISLDKYASAVIARYHRIVGITIEMYSLIVLEGRNS